MTASILKGRLWFQRRCDRTEYWLTIGLLLGLLFAAQSWPIAAGLGLNFAVFVLAARRLHCAATTATIVTLGLIAGERGANRFGLPPRRPDLAETFT
jgi:uncharacterized membrane protein YhaH (DUF805 family)